MKFALFIILGGVLSSCALYRPSLPTYLSSDSSKAVKLRPGDPAPFEGWLLSKEVMERILDVAAGATYHKKIVIE